MNKIDGLSDAISNASAEVLGNADSAEDSKTVYGLSKRLDTVIGTERDNSSQKTIYGLLAKIAELEDRITELHPITPVE